MSYPFFPCQIYHIFNEIFAPLSLFFFSITVYSWPITTYAIDMKGVKNW